MEQTRKKRSPKMYRNFGEFLKHQAKWLREENKKIDLLIEERRKILQQAQALAEVK